MNEEEKEAIESLRIKAKYIGENYSFGKQGIKNLKKDLNIALNLIAKLQEIIKKQSYTNKKLRNKIKTVRKERNKLQKELDKKDKVIDLMACELAIPGKSIELINLYNQVHPDKPIDYVIKEYFYKKAEEENE